MEQIGDKYYLSRDAVDNVKKYVVYRSDFPGTLLSDMQKVGETTDTKFEYPFNPNADHDTYAYYAVQAICSNGSALQLGSVKKVKVGPVDNVLLLLAMIALLYVGYRLHREVKSI
ncbi:MAG: hypothetical protein GXP45_07050 [bacterium]|nr:hypothetical protein [bacterium]